MHPLGRQSFQGRKQTISCLPPRHILIDGRIIGRSIHDSYPGRETLEQSI
jgi:hypothetical protein